CPSSSRDLATHSLSVDASISTRAFGRFPSTAANRSRSVWTLRSSMTSPSSPTMQSWLFTLCTSIPILSTGWPPSPCGFDRAFELWSFLATTLERGPAASSHLSSVHHDDDRSHDPGLAPGDMAAVPDEDKVTETLRGLNVQPKEYRFPYGNTTKEMEVPAFVR